MKQLRDFLTGLQNAAEVELAINDAMKDAGCKLFIDDGKENIFIPKRRLDAKISELAGANDKIAELDESIKTLKSQVGGNEEAQAKIAELTTSISEYENQVKTIKIDAAVQMLALESKAKDAKDLKAFLDLSKVSVGADGEVTGIKEQVESLKEAKAYLFDIEEKAPGGLLDMFGPGSPGKPSNEHTFGSKTMHAGDFGKGLAQASSQGGGDKQVDSDYFFK